MVYWVKVINKKVNIFLVGFFLMNCAFASDWRVLEKNVLSGIGNGVADTFYDRSSISSVSDDIGDSVFSVWEKDLLKKPGHEIGEIKISKRISCKHRTVSMESIVIDGRYVYPPLLGRVFHIEPDTSDEILFKIICKY